MSMLKIASGSDPSAAAGAVANTIREEGTAEMQAIGPKAVNQAVKCVSIARGYVAPSGLDLFFVPSFVDVEINEEMKTAVKFTVRSRTPVARLKPRTRQGGIIPEEGEL
ncbi:MAG: stage V sporulation protein S [Candidatus Bipolaricaulota bacterium]